MFGLEKNIGVGFRLAERNNDDESQNDELLVPEYLIRTWVLTNFPKCTKNLKSHIFTVQICNRFKRFKI